MSGPAPSDEIYAAALQSRHLVNEDGDAASIRDIQAALVAAWGDGLDPEGRQSIVDRSTTPFVGRRGRLARDMDLYIGDGSVGRCWSIDLVPEER